jgi:hypothetical protein
MPKAQGKEIPNGFSRQIREPESRRCDLPEQILSPLITFHHNGGLISSLP